MSETRGETFSLLREIQISTPTEEEAKEDIEEEEERRELPTGEERGSSSSDTGEKENFKPAGLSAGRSETGFPFRL